MRKMVRVIAGILIASLLWLVELTLLSIVVWVICECVGCTFVFRYCLAAWLIVEVFKFIFK